MSPVLAGLAWALLMFLAAGSLSAVLRKKLLEKFPHLSYLSGHTRVRVMNDLLWPPVSAIYLVFFTFATLGQLAVFDLVSGL